jgi:NDP-sugar pyrophosphorylase family protein
VFAVILAGGAGTRLRPLTYARRKELVPLLNRPLLEYRLLNLKQHGIRDVVLACSQGMGEIEEHFGDGSSLGLRMQYAYEDKPLGSGRAVKEAARFAGADGAIVVCNGDILTNLDLTGMIARHRETAATLSISLAPVDDPWHFGVVAVDDALRIEHFVEKPPQGEEPSNLINAGTWIWEPGVLDRIPDDDSAIRDGYSERVLFPGIIADGERVQGFTEDLWVDVGSPDRYFRATRLLLERATRARGTELIVEEGAEVHPTAELIGQVLIGAGAKLGASARVRGPSVIGPLSIVGARSSVDASVLWEEVRIGERASVNRSILGAYAGIGDRAVVEDAILGNAAEVEEDHQPEPGARVMPGERV